MITCGARYNIKYGNMDATDSEVEEAAVLADIHDTILSFPDKVAVNTHWFFLLLGSPVHETINNHFL